MARAESNIAELKAEVFNLSNGLSLTPMKELSKEEESEVDSYLPLQERSHVMTLAKNPEMLDKVAAFLAKKVKNYRERSLQQLFNCLMKRWVLCTFKW